MEARAKIFGHPLHQILVPIPLGLFVILADATFADYAGSPFTETAALNGLLVSLVPNFMIRRTFSCSPV